MLVALLKWLMTLLARLPLPLIHAAGVLVGWTTYWGDTQFTRRIKRNLAEVGLAASPKAYTRLLHGNVREHGKAILETLAIWFRPQAKLMRWVKGTPGWQYVEAALAQKKGIIFLTPHLGCYEITARYYADHAPITVLYRPARATWLSPILETGRNHANIHQAPTTLGGVRTLLKALRKGEAIGILPDQVPEFGEGVWADFFGKPAYTATLVSKLAEASDAAVLMAFGERLSWGRGYIIHIEPLAGLPTPENINLQIEHLVRAYPTQYLWSYKRFKQPKKQKASSQADTHSH